MVTLEEVQTITTTSWLVNTILAIAIFIIALIIGKIVRKTLEKVLSNLQVNELLEKGTKKNIQIDKIFPTIAAYIIYFFGFIGALTQIGIASTVLNLISGAVLILILIVVFLAFKDFVPNVTAGLFLLSKGYLKEKDTIKIHDIEGKIVAINLIETKVETKKGDLIIIPNSRLTKYEFLKKL